MRTYVFVIPSAFRVSAILRTGIRSTLESEPDTKILIASPFAEDQKFKEEFPNATHVPLANIPLARVRRVARIRDILFLIHRPELTKARLIEESVIRRRRVIVLSK